MDLTEYRQSMKCVKTIFQLGLLFLLVACAAPQVKEGRSYTPIAAASEIVQLPNLYVESSVEVGQSMISTVKRILNPAVRVSRDLVHSGTNSGYEFKLTIPAGYLLLRGRDNEGRYFEAAKPLSLQLGSYTGANAGDWQKDDNTNGVPVLKAIFGFHWLFKGVGNSGGPERDPITVTGGVYVPNDSARSTEIYWLSSDRRKPLNDPSAGMSFTVIEDYAEYDKDSFKRELVYSGISQKTISILYREFINDMARPAFSQELKYDLSQGEAIGFKGARFQVIKANNIEIGYKVLKHME